MQARSQVKIPEGAKPFAMKSTRQGNNDGEVLYLKYLHRVQSEAPEGAIEPEEGATAPSAQPWLLTCHLVSFHNIYFFK